MYLMEKTTNEFVIELKTLIDHTKVESFVAAFIEHGVEPAIDIPELDKESLENQKILTT